MIIRPATAADAPAIAAIKNHYIRNTIVTFNSAETLPEEICNAMLDQPFFVASLNESVIGYCSYGPFRRGVGYAKTVEHSIAVQDKVQTRGVGRALLETLIAHATTQGHKTMVACISADNTQGRNFHAKMGFCEMGYLSGVGYKFGRALDLVFAQKRL